jgi:hypothetical protein
MTAVELRFSEKSHPIFRDLQERIDRLPNDSLNFVAALMGVKNLIPAPLSDLVFGMIYVRAGIAIGPMHLALASAVSLRHQRAEIVQEMRDAKLALIAACDATKASLVALEFVASLHTLNTPFP